MEIIVDFSESGLASKDFLDRENLESLLFDAWKAERTDGNELIIDRETHSCACEFFKVIIDQPNLLVVKHTGGVS